jgi:hypothetical protein
VSGPASIIDNTLTWTNVGTITVRATQVGNDEFALVSVEQTFEVKPAPSLTSLVADWIVQQDPSISADQRGLLNDPDGDGVPNVLEYILGSNPSVKNSGDGRLPVGIVQTDGGQTVVVWVIQLNPTLPMNIDLPFETAESLDSAGWTILPSQYATRTGSQVTIRCPTDQASRFIRLKFQALL